MSVSLNEQGQFWIDVIAAHDRVAINNELQIEVSRDGKYALVWYDEAGSVVVIEINETDTETRDPLPVPGGS